jgi:mono/diheme cytochrome c family protein
MNRKACKLFYLFFWALIILAGSCKHECDDYVPEPEPPQNSCDTVNVTYPGSVVPIFEEYCNDCHSGAQPSGNLDLTDYEQVSFIAENGALVGAIRHLPGYSPMPQGGDMLEECLIRTIEIWIADTTFAPPVTPHPCDPDTVYFAKDLLPILQSSCAQPGCHDATAQDGVRLDSYEAVMASNIVEPFNPSESDLYEVVIEDDPDKRMPPPPLEEMSTDRIQLIYKWIQQGAQDLTCDEDCDTTNVTFSGTIWPNIIEKHCFGCHKNPNPLGGLALENYSDVAAIASDGRLLGVVTHSSGYSPMPKNAPKLSDCKITQITKWIEDGIPDN